MVEDVASDEQWAVYIEWVGRERVNNLTPRQLARRARRAYSLAGETLASGIDAFAYGSVAVIAVALLVIALGPLVFAVLLGVVELVLLFAVIAGAAAWKLLFRRPWRIVAVHETGDVWSWEQAGWRRARRLVATLQAELDAGGDPLTTSVGAATFLGQTSVAVTESPPVWSRGWFRWSSRAAAMMLFVVGVVAVLVRYVA